ncbi:hypothetical protein AgCh_019269 [Apium graveolens]
MNKSLVIDLEKFMKNPIQDFPRLEPKQYFTQDTIFIPACYKEHWILIFLDVKSRKIVCLDSLRFEGAPDFYSQGKKNLFEGIKDHILPVIDNELACWNFMEILDIPKQNNNEYMKKVFGLGLMIDSKIEDSNAYLRAMAVKMKKKFEKYWENIDNINVLLFITLILDLVEIFNTTNTLGQHFATNRATKLRGRASEISEALKLYGRAWRHIEGTKTAVQIQSHDQKFFSKVARDPNYVSASSHISIEIPPPRPKKKPLHPYPRKVADLLLNRVVVQDQVDRCLSTDVSLKDLENLSPISILPTIGSEPLSPAVS